MGRRGRRAARLALVVVLIVGGLSCCSTLPFVRVVMPPSGPAASALDTLEVHPWADAASYDRAAFGPAWSDATGATWSRNGCDQRNDVLRRDLDGVRLKPGTDGCAVAAGFLRDPYTGGTVSFLRGRTTSDDVQIDHVVALSNAWKTGAARFDAGTRARLANDPLNLVAVEGAVNQSKGDGDAAAWLPPSATARCAYVARQVAVKQRYGLWVTAGERSAIRRVLAACPGQDLPESETVRLLPPGLLDR